MANERGSKGIDPTTTAYYLGRGQCPGCVGTPGREQPRRLYIGPHSQWARCSECKPFPTGTAKELPGHEGSLKFADDEEAFEKELAKEAKEGKPGSKPEPEKQKPEPGQTPDGKQ